MSLTLATAAIAALFIALLAPLVLAALKKVSAVRVTAFYAVLLCAAGGYQSGLFSRVDLPDLNLPDAATPAATEAQCLEILTLLDRAGAIIDRGTPPRLVVSRERWSQLPESGQTAVLDCVQRSWPRNAGAPQIEAR